MVTASGGISLPLKYMKDTIAASSNFQTWVSAASAAAALAYIHVVVAPSGYTLPCAVVEWEAGMHWPKVSGGQQNFFDQSGKITVLFQEAIVQSTEENAAFAFTNTLGAIVDDIQAIAGQATYLNIDDIVLETIARPDEDERQTVGTDFYQSMMTFSFEGKGH